VTWYPLIAGLYIALTVSGAAYCLYTGLNPFKTRRWYDRGWRVTAAVRASSLSMDEGTCAVDLSVERGDDGKSGGPEEPRRWPPLGFHTRTHRIAKRQNPQSQL